MVQENATCGNCGNKYSEHHAETHGGQDYVFCNMDTNGDVFTDEPSDSALMDFIRDRYENFLNAIVKKWKSENGHETVADE
jgi:uncharacterized protein (DUF2147 family)